ncbi:MAG: 4a-hydroxytetrahydrobiopterin dehydratase [Oleiphilaceae bacterium]|nr:4a-hydroxytetrahydrobiopterin dehydratase [Oleiphilaceae bacterium]
MSELENQHCEACSADAPRVTREEMEALGREVPDWSVIELDGEQQLQRQFQFKNFAQALGFTVKVGEMAEEVNHHPAILTEYGKVTVRWWTHKIGGLHRNDYIMAARTDGAYRDFA